MAGLYDIWKDPENGKEIYSYTIITTKTNELVGRIHDRMPVILRKDDEENWLNPDNVEPDQLLTLLKPFPGVEMDTYEVPRAVWNPRLDTQELIKPVSNGVQQSI